MMRTTEGDRVAAVILDDCGVTQRLLTSMLRDTPVDVLGGYASVADVCDRGVIVNPVLIFVDMLTLGRACESGLQLLRERFPVSGVALSTTHSRWRLPYRDQLPWADAYLLRPYHYDRVTETVLRLCRDVAQKREARGLLSSPAA